MSPVVIKITSQADLGAFGKTEKALAGVRGEAQKLVEQLKLGASIDVGGRIVSGFARLPGILREALAAGVEVNRTFENTRNSIAAVIKTFRGDEVGTFNAALVESDKTLKIITRTAEESILTRSQLIENFTNNAANLFGAGIDDAERQVDLVKTLSQAVKGFGLDAFQGTQEIRAILTGDVGGRDATLARGVGITTADIERAKEAGTLYEFLTEKFKEFQGLGADSFDVASSNLQQAVKDAKASLGQPLFLALKDSYQGLADLLNSPEVRAQLKAVGVEVAGLVGQGLKLTAWALANAPALLSVASALVKVGAGLAAIKLVKILTGLVSLGTGFGAATASVTANTAALAANSAAATANAAAQARAGAAAGVAGAASSLGAGAAGAAAAGASTGKGFLSGFKGALSGGFFAVISRVFLVGAAIDLAIKGARAAGEKVGDAMAEAIDGKALRNAKQPLFTSAGFRGRLEGGGENLDDLQAEVEKDIARRREMVRNDSFNTIDDLVQNDKELARLEALLQEVQSAPRSAQASGQTPEKLAELAAENAKLIAGAKAAGDVLAQERVRLTDELAAAVKAYNDGLPDSFKLGAGDDARDAVGSTGRIIDLAQQNEKLGILSQIIDLQSQSREIEEGIARAAEDGAAARQREFETRRAAAQAEFAAQKQAGQDAREELDILRAKASGNEALAETLERERSIREAAAQIAKDQGIADAAALAQATELVDLRRQIAGAGAAGGLAALGGAGDGFIPGGASFRPATSGLDFLAQNGPGRFSDAPGNPLAALDATKFAPGPAARDIAQPDDTGLMAIASTAPGFDRLSGALRAMGAATKAAIAEVNSKLAETAGVVENQTSQISGNRD